MNRLHQIVSRLSATFSGGATFLVFALFTRQKILICITSSIVVFAGVWGWKKAIQVAYKPKHPRLRIISVAFLTLAICFYCISYIPRTIRGRYEPAVIGLNGVKAYEWAPEGFVTDFVWNKKLGFAYWPLHRLDKRFWHDYRNRWNPRYSVNNVPREEIGRVYRAWDLLK